MREDVHVQVADGVLGEAVEAEEEVLFPAEPLERGLHGLEMGEDGGADGGVVVVVGVVVVFLVGRGGRGRGSGRGGRGGGRGGKEFPVLLLEGAFSAREDLGFTVRACPEAEEVRAHFVHEGAVVGRGGGVDDVVHAGFGDDEGVGEGLAFGAFARGRGRVLPGVVGGEVADDVGVDGFAEDEVGGVVGAVFLFDSGFNLGLGWGAGMRMGMGE